ncbi:MAG: tetratricopeptide repeat protein [Gemmataceae bacterium]|nr:tetratricopeptide repeat protein [Gemmataceae bacterium]
MHRIFLGFSLCALVGTLVLTGCDKNEKPAVEIAQLKANEQVPPGEGKPLPPGEDKPIPKGNPNDPAGPAPVETKTDPDFLPVLPQLTAPTGDDKYEEALGRAFVLMAEKKDREALAALKEAQAAKDSDFVKTEITRIEDRLARNEVAQKAADDIREVLENGKPSEASQLATDALGQYGDSELAETLTGLKRQADALLSAGLEDKARKQRFLAEAEAARKAGNLRSAVLSYEQAIASGAEPGELKESYESLRQKLANYDDNRTKAAELRKAPYQLEQAVTSLKVAAENWDTPQVRQEISETQIALNNRRDRVAIADFEVINDIGVPKAGHVIGEELIGHMKPRFDVVERSQVRTLFAQMKLDNNELTSNDDAREEFGRIVQARFVVLGSVNRVAGIHVNARLVDTQTGLIVQTARIVASTPAEMMDRLPALGRMLQMSDDEKRSFERDLAAQARPVAPPAPQAQIPPPPPPEPLAAAPPPPPIIVFTPRPPEFGRVVIADFHGFRFMAVGAPPPPPVVIVDAPVLIQDRAFFVAIELGDNLFRRGLFREALRNFDFALAINPGNAAIRFRVQLCRPFCPPPVVFVPMRPRLVVLPFAEFRDPFAFPSSIPLGLGLWTGDAIAPYFSGQFDIVDKGELFWWMGRLGMTMRDVLTNPHARLCLGRALGARFFLMGSLREVASFDATTHLIDAELNVQTNGASIRVQNAAELNFRLSQLARLTVMPPQQQVVVVQQQQVVQRRVVAAQVEFRKGNFAISLGFFKEVLVADPGNVEARQMVLQIGFRSRQSELEAQRIAAFQQQQAASQAQRDRQIASAAASEAVRLQAQRDRGKNQQVIAQQQIIAQQNLLNQALLAQRQNDLERRVTLLESANGIRRDDKVVQELAEARAQLAVERQKRQEAELALRELENKRTKDAELVKIDQKLVLARDKQQAALELRVAQNQAEYERFLDHGQLAMTTQKYPLAVTSFQNARRLKPSPEVEKLISAALVEQARTDAEAKGEVEKKKLESQLAQEQERNKDLEIQNAKIRAKYQTAFDAGQSAMKSKQFDQAVTSFRLASKTMQTDEATKNLDLAENELAYAEAEAKKNAEASGKQATIDKHLTAGRTALAAKQFEKAIVSFRAAAGLKPGDVEIQKLLNDAEQSHDQALAAERRKQESDQQLLSLRKLVAGGEQNLKAKRFDAAIVSFGDALKIDPEHKDATAGLKQAQAGAATVNTDAASQAEAKQKRDDFEKAMRQGRAAMSLKQFDKAIGFFKQAQTLLPGDVASNDLLAEATKRNADTAATEAARKKAAELNQAVTSGRTALRTQRFDDAQTAADSAMKIAPESVEVKKLIADIADAKKAHLAAMQKKEAEGKKAAQVDALLDKARAALQAKDLEQADKFLADATAIDATDPDIKKVRQEFEALRNKMVTEDIVAKNKQQAYLSAMKNGSTAFTAKQYALAVAQARIALVNKPGDGPASKLLADAQKADAAGDAAAMEAKKKQEAYDAAMKTGRGAMTRKDFAAAEKAFLDALKADSGDPAATMLLKQARAGFMDQAEMAKRKALYDQWMDRAKLLMGMKNYEDAIVAYQTALKVLPGDVAAATGLATARSAMNAKKDPPIPPKKDPPKVDPKPKDPPKVDPNLAKIATFMKVAAGEENVGKYANAYQTYQEVLKLAPTNPDAKKQAVFCQWMDQGQRQLAAGKLAEAATSFEQALKIDPVDANAKKLLAQARAKKK